MDAKLDGDAGLKPRRKYAEAGDCRQLRRLARIAPIGLGSGDLIVFCTLATNHDHL